MTLDVWDRTDGASSASSASSAPGRSGAFTAAGRSGGSGGSGRRRALWVAVVLVVLALVVAAVVAGVRRHAHQGEPLDPQNPGREGAQALASVLRDHDVQVDVARGEADLLDARVGAGTTVVVTRTGELSAETATTMLEHVSGADRLVLVEPDRFLLTTLELPVDPSGQSAAPDEVTAGCRLDGLSAGDRVLPSQQTYVATVPGPTTCFPHDGSFELVAVPPTDDQPEVLVLGNSALLANSQITLRDHAGVALRMLGRGDRVVWYVPSALDIGDEDATPTSEVPRALGPLVFLGGFGLLALVLWRGRRFGPLVTEPLPAVVKAIETTQSRGRLYRKARDTERAGTVLRARTAKRLAGYLGLPAGAAPATVAQAAAAASHRDPQGVVALFTAPPPTTEAALVALANDLTDLEKEVRRA